MSAVVSSRDAAAARCSSASVGHLLLREDEHLLVEKLYGEPVLIVRRTASAPTAEVVRGFAATLNAAFAGLDRSRHAVLIDLRLAPLRMGADLDEALESFRVEVARDAVAVARLVATSVGALQVNRMDRAETRPVESFADEEYALRWLRTELARAKRARR
jgi:hypothetical protein